MPKHPLYESPIKGTSIPVTTPAPAASEAFPANRELKGRTRSDPPPRAERATKPNMFNVDKHGRRPAMKPPSRVR